MKLFHISDVLTVTTGRLVSRRHMAGVYDILNFLTGDDLFTHQLPRAVQECEPWLKTQFPQLSPTNPIVAGMIAALDMDLALAEPGGKGQVIANWVELVRTAFALPESLPVYELGSEGLCQT